MSYELEMQILCGPIASGKSTYCKQKAKEGYCIINDDAIILALHAGDYKLYSKILKPIYKTIETAMITACLAGGVCVVIDRPNFSVDTRRRYIGLAKAFDAEVNVVLFQWERPEVSAQRRFSCEPRGLSYEEWLGAAKHHLEMFDYPNAKLEGFSSILPAPPHKTFVNCSIFNNDTHGVLVSA